MTFRFRNKRCNGGHGDVTFSFKSRHVDEALLAAAFDRRFAPEIPTENHPMRYWAIAGWGPVPAVLRAPEGIYRELELINPSDLDGRLQCSDWPLWFGKHHQNIIFFGDLVTYVKVGEVKWVAAIDVRDDTTVENLIIPPKGSKALVCSPEELQTIRPPTYTATGREYIEMTSGEFIVRDGSRFNMWKMVARVGNAAVGKWFWELYPRREESLLSQLVVWHESVDDTDEYKSPCQGPENDVIKMCHSVGFCDDSPQFEFVVKERKEALAVVETFLWTADAEPQLKRAMVQFMTFDPNGLWWKRGEFSDGFLLSGTFFPSPVKLLVGELRCEKLCFESVVQALLDCRGHTLARTIMGGRAVTVPDDEFLLSIQFKPSRVTGKIVAMRVVFITQDADSSRRQ